MDEEVLIPTHEEIERWKQLRPTIIYVTPEQEALIKCLVSHRSGPIAELSEIIDALLSTGEYRPH